ncbi:hypothetical protein LQZ19_09615 [Treponema primitia]|uniref:hypothetical protein n=1 Tax=Treponema primitia TaxID=88058 RepID=UPI00397FC600
MIASKAIPRSLTSASGMGFPVISTGCKNVRDIKFIPLQTECYDLIIRKADAAKQPYRKILDIVTSKGYRLDLENIGGFNTRETGKIL